MQDQELTLLSEGQIWGNDSEAQLDVMKKYGIKAALTDLAILTGAYVNDSVTIDEDKSLSGRSGWFWTRSDDKDGDVRVVDDDGGKCSLYRYRRSGAIRPALQSSLIFSTIFPNRVRGYNGVYEVEYGEYPQMAANAGMQNILETEWTQGLLKKTGRRYTFDSRKYNDYDNGFNGVTYEECEYQGKKYIRVKANSDFGEGKFKLSNGMEYKNEDFVWVEVSPVKWLINDETQMLVSKKGLLSGIRYHEKNKKYNGNFSTTEMKEYLDKHMSRDLFQTATLSNITDLSEEERTLQEKKRNPYGFKFGTVSEEDIIKGALESGVAVFLHGQSSEGKSARVKQIDPTCEIIYLRNATPDSLNGKSVYIPPITKKVEIPVNKIEIDPDTNKEKPITTYEYQEVIVKDGYMLDVKPSWLKKVEEKCKIEPDRLHVVFFDEITNALPSIQGIAFNIVLDREVNGIWKLPENARIVAAGNEMKDSLAANQLAEPLFNRFAHVYIKTTTESWLKWASENNIHPAIYSYIAYRRGETLRSKYDGEKPNADPRKWEMASKMLYATGKPEMLRALIGEDITREFVQFCNQLVITLDDVIKENYTDGEIQALDTAERYATTMGLLQVDNDNLKIVRNFIAKLGEEFGAIFDTLWTHGDESKLEILAEAKLEEMSRGGITK